MADALASRLAANVAHLREARGLTQSQIAKIAGVPRATWAHLESGTANPTLTVLHRAAAALQVSLEELVSSPRSGVKHYPAASRPTKIRGDVQVRKLLPDPVPGMEIDRMELPPRARMTGIPHTPGTTEYLTCEAGTILLVASGGPCHRGTSSSSGATSATPTPTPEESSPWATRSSSSPASTDPPNEANAPCS